MKAALCAANTLLKAYGASEAEYSSLQNSRNPCSMLLRYIAQRNFLNSVFTVCLPLIIQWDTSLIFQYYDYQFEFELVLGIFLLVA